MALLEVFSATGQTLYSFIRNEAGQVWDGTAFEDYVAASWASYVIPLTEDAASGYYKATMPVTIPAQKVSHFTYLQLGGSPAAGDDVAGSATLVWNGVTFGSTGITTAVDVVSINGSTAAAINLSMSASAIITAQAVAGTLTVAQMTTSLPSSVSKFYIGRVIIFITGALAGQAAAISGYDGATKRITFFMPVTSAPANGDTFIML